MKRVTVLILASILLASCAPQQAPVPTMDVGAISTHAVETALASVPTQPPLPTPTEMPAPTSTSPAPSNEFAWNYIASQNSGGLVIEIARFVIADKAAIPEFNFSAITAFDDKPIVGEIVFKVTNTTSQVMSVFPDQGDVIVGSEQISLREYMFFATFGDDVGGEIYPGVTKIGGIWFGVKRSALPEIQSVTINIGTPSDASFMPVGPAFVFTLDLSNRQYQSVPDELK